MTVDRLKDGRDPSAIGSMFDAIAHRYDLMNRLMTLGMDGRWRKVAGDAAALKPGGRALDVATGTGDMAIELARRVMPAGEVVGLDISDAMMEVARRKAACLPVSFERGDVMEMGYQNEFDAVTVAFGLRNFADRGAGVAAMARALRTGGRLVVLELVPAKSALAPVIRVYEQQVIPLLGGLISGNRGAYTYLPRSVAAMLTAREMEGLLRDAGLRDVQSRHMGMGTVAIVWGTK